MNEIKKLALVLGSVLLFVVYYILCSNSAQEARNYYEDGSSLSQNSNFLHTSIEEEIHQYVIRNTEREATITAVGDIMFYDYQMSRAYNSEKGSFDFSPSFQYISKYLDESAYVMGNLEGTMAGKDKGAGQNDYGYWADSNNMNFNIPEKAADALKDAGFDLLTTANNHVLDSGMSGVDSTIDFITGAGLDQTGSFKSSSDARYMIKNVDGVNIGIIAYTNFINETVDDTNNYIINNLEDYSSTKIKKMCGQITSMREAGADFIVVSMHFGGKYVSEVTQSEQNLATQLVGAGADLIIGSYPHVVKRMEVIQAETEDGTRNGIVFYSLGNFISSMQYQATNGYNRDLGLMVSVHVTKTSEGTAMDEIELIPLYTDWTDTDIAVLPLCEVHDNEEAFAERFANDSGAYVDTERINAGYDSIIKTVVGDSGLKYEYSDYTYKIKLR